MPVPPLWSQIDASLLSDIVNAPGNAQIKPSIQRLIRMRTRHLPNPIQQLAARKTFLLERYRDDAEARQKELSQLLYGYLGSLDEKLVESFAAFAKEARGPEDEIFFTTEEMRAAIEELRPRCEDRFLFLHTYAFALLQAEPAFLLPLEESGGQLAEWTSEVLAR